MLIRNYGEFWNPDIINWGGTGKGTLTGFVKIVEKEKVEKKTESDVSPESLDNSETNVSEEVKPDKVQKRKFKSVEIDFWDAKGIYVLYSDFQPVYVGKAFGKTSSIGVRVRAHLTDRLAGRWDMFSWFSISSIRFTKKDVSQPAQRQYKPETINNTLEALAIIIANPRLNRRVESLEGATLVRQPESKTPKTIRNYLQNILENTEEIKRK